MVAEYDESMGPQEPRTLSDASGPEPEDDTDEAVDLDLDLEGEQLRKERVGNPIVVRVGGQVIHILHPGAWPSSAMRGAGQGDWDAWAQGVIDDPKELKTWMELDLENFQIEAVFAKCGENARMTTGKSQRRSGSRAGMRKR
jgi:hypothetical protein